MSKFTASGARRAGDEYQDLQSAEILIEWLEDPARYRWVRLEAMDGSLDDIQAEQADGTLKLLQVKFGVNYADNWTWNDFTQQDPGKRVALKPSLLQKWSKSLRDAQIRANVSISALVTNRSAEDGITKALDNDGHVKLSMLDDAVRQVVIAQLGSEAAAGSFFDAFQFKFLDPSPDALTQGLLTRFLRLGGTIEGWYGLLDAVRRWINFQDQPRGTGRIVVHDIQAAALWHRPSLIPQSFLIPEEFVPPKHWSEQVVEPAILQGTSSRVVVVTGSPGIGKSTYLSWLVDRLRSKDVPVIRHHFFLSLTDATLRRTSWEAAADALIGQLQREYPELVATVGGENPKPESLRDFLEAAGQARQGATPLVVVIDGLDHVWRDTGSSDNLTRLFDFLLPGVSGAVLVLGSQTIDASRLPAKLRSHAPQNNWMEVPALDATRVRRWLRLRRSEEMDPADDAGRLAQVEDELVDTLCATSAGHPLVLHYAYVAARQRATPVVAANVRSAPAFEPTSGMAAYYQGLWDELTPLGHALLHLLAGFPWAWPDDGLVQCLTPESDSARLAEAEIAVRHLLGRSSAGLTAFHESLLAFVRHRPDHERDVTTRRASVERWLGTEAPAYLKWRHAWTERAKGGDAQPLIEGPTLEWCVEALGAGRGRLDVAEIVAASGHAALAAANIGRATERHFIDANLEEAGSAGSVLAGLRWIALQLADPAVREANLNVFVATCATATDAECAAVSEVAFAAGYSTICDALFDEGAKRWDASVGRADHHGGSLAGHAIALPTLIATILDDPEQGVYRRALKRDSAEPPYCRTLPYIHALARLCRIGARSRAIRHELRYLASCNGRRSRHAIDEVVRLACTDGFDPTVWVGGNSTERGGLLKAYQMLVEPKLGQTLASGAATSFADACASAYDVQEEVFVDQARDFFFECLAVGGAVEFTGVPDKSVHVQRFLRLLHSIAIEGAKAASSGNQLGPAWFLSRMTRETRMDVPPNDYDNRAVRPFVVGRLVVAIALDFESLENAAGRQSSLTADALGAALDTEWTWAQSWVEATVEQRRPLRNAEAARLLLERERSRLAETRDTLHARAEQYVVLGQFAWIHREQAQGVKSLALLAARNLLGHGYRKDDILSDVLDSIELAHTGQPGATLDRIKRIAPLARVITDISDGKGTRHLPRAIAGVLSENLVGALPSWFRTLQNDEEHWIVESCFTDLATNLPFATEPEIALGSTLVHEAALTALQKRAQADDRPAALVLEATLAHMGRTDVDPSEDESASSRRDPAAEPVMCPQADEYPPENVGAFISALRESGDYGDATLAAWTEHWKSVAPERLLAALGVYHSAHGYPPERQSGRAVVALARELEGAAAAWRWLTIYHDALSGWSRFSYRMADVIWIWEEIANRYRDRWLQFVIETSLPRWGSAGDAPSWSAERMARFLIAVGQPAAAQQVVDSAVQWGASLAADMRLPESGLSEDLALSPILRMLVDRLDCPSRMVQERAAWALSRIIADPSLGPSAAATLSAWHDASPCEMRTCLFLLILVAARTRHQMDGAACTAVALHTRLVPSIGGDLLFCELAGTDIPRTMGSHLASARVVGLLPDFATVVRAHLAPIFLHWAGVLDRRTHGFFEQWKAEALALAEAQGLTIAKNAHFPYHYRGGLRERSLQIHDRMSVLLRSAMLRTLTSESETGRLDGQIGKAFALNVAVLLDPGMWCVQPTRRPTWWPADPGIGAGVDALPQAVGDAIRARLQNHVGPVLAYAAGPVGNRDNLSADLVIRAFVQSCRGACEPAAEELAEIPSVACTPSVPGIDTKGTFQPLAADAGVAADWLLAPLAWTLVPDTVDWLLPERSARGLHVPASWLAPDMRVIPGRDKVETVHGDLVVGSWTYWNDDLRERHYVGAGPRVGAELLLERGAVESQLDRGGTLCWVITLDVAQRLDYAEKFGPPVRVGTWVIGGSNIVRQRPWTPPNRRSR